VLLPDFFFAGEDILEIETWFHSHRSVLPSLFLSTPYDRKNSIWTKEGPSLQILIRVAMLAGEALRVIEGLLFSAIKSDWKVRHFSTIIMKDYHKN
jgi:Nrap protein.